MKLPEVSTTALKVDKNTLTVERTKKGWSLDKLAEKAYMKGASSVVSTYKGTKAATVIGMAKALGSGERWWRLLIPEQCEEFDKTEPTDGATRVPLSMFHRSSTVREKFYATALGSGGRVLYVSIMSQDSFALLDQYLTDNTTLDVLTWKPETAEEIKGFAKHLHEETDKVEQTKNALLEWDKRIDQNHKEYKKNITVRTYDSAPTMQGVLVKDGWALIELIPYNTKTKTRPALLLKNEVESERSAFDFFWDRFEAIWRRSEKTPRKIGEIPDW